MIRKNLMQNHYSINCSKLFLLNLKISFWNLDP